MERAARRAASSPWERLAAVSAARAWASRRAVRCASEASDADRRCGGGAREHARRQAGRSTSRQTGRQAGKQASRQAARPPQAGAPDHRGTHRTHRHRERQAIAGQHRCQAPVTYTVAAALPLHGSSAGPQQTAVAEVRPAPSYRTNQNLPPVGRRASPNPPRPPMSSSPATQRRPVCTRQPPPLPATRTPPSPTRPLRLPPPPARQKKTSTRQSPPHPRTVSR